MPLTTPYPPDLEPRRRRRAGLVLGGVAVLIIIVLVGLIAFLLGRGPGQPPAPGIPVVPSAPLPGPGAGGWDVAAETALATRPMLEFPEQATQPHAMTTNSAGPPIRVPKAGATAGRLVPGGFPDTPEGAVGQLAALSETGLFGGDPQAYAQAYQSIALPGAPPAASTSMYTGLQQLRAGASIPATGGVNGLTISYRTTDGLIKGTTDGGGYAVVCVLGELTAGYQGQSISGGIGDCQAMRYVDGNWLISPGAAAFKGPSAWPGTAEAVAAGYRTVS